MGITDYGSTGYRGDPLKRAVPTGANLQTVQRRISLMIEYKKPLPSPDEVSEPYWEACKQGKLLLQKCRNCGALQTFPRSLCYKCLSDALDWVPASGRGTIYTFSTIYRPPAPEFAGDVPYTIALVELEEGVRMMSNIVDCAPDDIEIGMGVQVVFDNVTPDVALPKFRPARA